MKNFIPEIIIASIIIMYACSGNSGKKEIRPLDTEELAENVEQTISGQKVPEIDSG